MRTPQEALAAAIDAAGSQSELARRLNKRPQTVQYWVASGIPVPAEYVRDIERETGVPRYELRPDLYEPPARQSRRRAG